MAAHLIIGGNGTIGGALADLLRRRGDLVHVTTRRPDATTDSCLFLDVAQSLDRWEPEIAYDTVFLCTGADPARCEKDPEESRKTNVTGPLVLAERAIHSGAFVVRLSSNAVFDGSRPWQRAHDAASPKTLYGRMHSEADRLFLDLGPRIAIVRFTKAVRARSPLFCDWLSSLKQGAKIRPLSDMYMAPITYPFIVDLIGRVGAAARPGIFQASGIDDMSYAAFAGLLARRLGVRESLVEPATMAEMKIDSRFRGRYSTLDMAETETSFGIGPQPVNEVVDDMGRAG